jgi:Tat protein translocase TatB subunit
LFDIGPEKILLVAVIALVFLGPEKLPGLFRSIGRGLSEFRKASSAVQAEITGALASEKDEPSGQREPAGSPAGDDSSHEQER